jgi:hypothetical protein
VGTHLPFTCRDVEICAAALLDGQLSPAEEEMVGDHLEHCDACAGLIDALETQRLKPPRIKLIQDNDYWEEMDVVLQSELDRAEQEQQGIPPKTILLYAAILLLSLAWGWHQRQRAEHLERIVYTQQQTLEQLERISVPSTKGALVETSEKAHTSYKPAKLEL